MMMTACSGEKEGDQASPTVSTLTVKAGVQTMPISKGWDYWENSTRNVEQARVQRQWQVKDLPHTWNQFDATDNNPGYRRDESWYRKSVMIPKLDESKIIQLYSFTFYTD